MVNLQDGQYLRPSDPAYEQVLDSLAMVARHTPVPLLEALLRWRERWAIPHLVCWICSPIFVVIWIAVLLRNQTHSYLYHLCLHVDLVNAFCWIPLIWTENSKLPDNVLRYIAFWSLLRYINILWICSFESINMQLQCMSSGLRSQLYYAFCSCYECSR